MTVTAVQPGGPYLVDWNACRRRATELTGDRREAVAKILRMVAADGLPGPRDLDVALDAIESAIRDCDPAEH